MSDLVQSIAGMLAGCVTDQGDVEVVDVGIGKVPVNRANAEVIRRRLVDALAEWPSEAWGQPVPPLAQGPSYIHVGAVLDDQGTALRLFAVGKVLGLWSIVTPATLGIEGDEARQMMGAGFVMIDGYHPERVA